MTLLCAGEAFEDLIFLGLDHLPALGEEVKTDRFASTIGGGAVITAVKAARLGMTTTLVSALSNAAMARLRNERLTITNLRKKGEPHAITAALSAGGERAFVTYNGVNAHLEDRLARALTTRLPADSRTLKADSRKLRADHVHLCFFPHDCARWTRILARLRASGITTSWDFGWNEPLTNDRGLTALVDALDFVFVNEHEAKLYTGTTTLADATAVWRERQAITIVKLGPAGAVWLAPDRDVYTEAPPVKRVVDTTGAGDSFNAGFLVAWLGGKSPEACLTAGNQAGAASTKHAGGI
jgi:sugar/nucleoside kinase (ribokinase family)